MPRPRPTRRQVIQRLKDRSHWEDECRIWDGTLDKFGYGVINISNRVYRVHKLAWLLERGPVPPGHNLHHTCETPKCIRPKHLVPMKQGEHLNLHRKVSIFCPQGHLMEGWNLVIKSNGDRRCRACHTLRERKRRAVAREGRN